MAVCAVFTGEARAPGRQLLTLEPQFEQLDQKRTLTKGASNLNAVPCAFDVSVALPSV